MRILFLSHRFYPDVGGIEVNSEILASAFQEAGHEVRLLTWSRDERGKTFSFPVTRSPGLWSLIRHHAWADLVYENNPCLRLAWPALFLGKPGVVAIRTWLSSGSGKNRWQEKIKLRWLRRARSVIAVSDAVRKKCWPSAEVIHNPYRAGLFRCADLQMRGNSFVLLGRLVSDKGADLAIQAFALMLQNPDVHDSGDPFRLTIVGDGPDRAKLELLAAELGVSGSVRFRGTLRDEPLVQCLSAHSFILVPSRWEEPFGNVALEGMACGCIPVVSDGGGLPEAVGNAGLTFPRGNIQALMRCMSMLVNDEALKQRLRDAARAHLSAHHPSIVAGRYLDVVQRALN